LALISRISVALTKLLQLAYLATHSVAINLKKCFASCKQTDGVLFPGVILMIFLEWHLTVRSFFFRAMFQRKVGVILVSVVFLIVYFDIQSNYYFGFIP